MLPHTDLSLRSLPAAPVVTNVGPNFSLGELQGHLAYDLNPSGAALRRTLPSTSSSGSVPETIVFFHMQDLSNLLPVSLLPSPTCRSKRHKSGSMEEDLDTSPGGEYYPSPSSPASSSRNWQEEMEGGDGGRPLKCALLFGNCVTPFSLCPHAGISPTVKKTEMDSPSPQEGSPRLGSFTQHHRPVIAVHSGLSRSPHPSSSLHFPTSSILPQTASAYFQHTAIRYPPHLSSQDPLKDLVSLACDPSSQQPGPLNGSGQVKLPSHYISSQMLAPPPPPNMPRLTLPPDSKSSTTTAEGEASSPTSPSKCTFS
ncbi:hypothetical protein Z043_115559 [Scleropages formosus]|uniref:Nuclear factor 1 C-type-like n=1 Tax=Scleropages formosus TaxID=113540 RepID=A0A0P7UDY5_SCLFO|nr:hypothetical protein Z043_115559 [Scleropages formosus]